MNKEACQGKWMPFPKEDLDQDSKENDNVNIVKISDEKKKKIQEKVLQAIDKLEQDFITKTPQLFLLNLQLKNLLKLVEITDEKKEFELFERTLRKINSEIDNIKKKDNNNKEFLLKNIIGSREYALLMIHSCNKFKRADLKKQIQFRLIYTLLFYTGLRLTVLLQIPLINILNSIETGELVCNDQVFYLEKNGQNALKSFKFYLIELIENDGLKYLGSSRKSKEKSISEKTWINLISQDMSYCLKEIGQLEGKYSSEIFRRSFMGRLAIVTTFPIIKQIVNANYETLNKNDIQNILAAAFFLPEIDKNE